MKAAEDNGMYNVQPVPSPSSRVNDKAINHTINNAHRLVTLIRGVINQGLSTIEVKSISSKDITIGIVKENHS